MVGNVQTKYQRRAKKAWRKGRARRHYKNIEGTNNAAERAIRNDVIIRKISGGNRSTNGRHE
ncbi:MAG: transposase [Candidatus Aenigmarchaeota archaeon]|nr:transposase [Candidatus Aenigmarchaeota archaeon]